MTADQRDRRSRRRVITSIISLLILLALLLVWCNSGGRADKKLGSITTATVNVDINTNGGERPERGTIGGPQRPNRRPPLLAEVLGERDEPRRTGTDDEDAEREDETIEVVDEGEPPPETDETALPAPTPTPPGGQQQSSSGGSVVRPSILKVTNPFVPGSYATGTVRVSNTGGSEFLFSVSVTSTGSSALAGVLRLRISDAGGGSCSFTGAPTSGDDFLASGSTVLYVGSFATGNKVGDPSLESAFGDQSLAPGTSRLLCVELFYPWSSGNELQGEAVLGTFIFTAKTPS